VAGGTALNGKNLRKPFNHWVTGSKPATPTIYDCLLENSNPRQGGIDLDWRELKIFENL